MVIGFQVVVTLGIYICLQGISNSVLVVLFLNCVIGIILSQPSVVLEVIRCWLPVGW